MQLIYGEKILTENLIDEGDTKKILFADTNLYHQLFRVMRMKKNDDFFYQYTEGKKSTRHTIKIDTVQASGFLGKIQSTEINYKKDISTMLVVSIPNKRSKIETIVQKASEIGIDTVCFRKSHYSQLDYTIFDNTKKRDRLKKISQEATEQSRGRFTTNIVICKDTKERKISTKIFLGDTKRVGKSIFTYNKTDTKMTKNIDTNHESKKIYTFFVGPEGGRHAKDKDYIKQNIGTKSQIEYIDLGDRILRTETACVLSGSFLSHLQEDNESNHPTS